MLLEAWILCVVESMLDEVCVYAKYAKLWNMMNEDASIFRSQWYKNCDLVKRCALMYTLILTHFEWMNEAKEY